MKDYNYPYWSKEYKSARHFRSIKRKQVRTVLKAIDDLRVGCAYTPAQDHIDLAEHHLEEARDRMRVKEWKR